MPVGIVGGALSFGTTAASIGATAAGAASSSAASHEANKMQMYAAAQQQQLAAKALSQYKKDIAPYVGIGTANIAPYQEALNQYQKAIPGYFDQVGQYQNAVNAYNANALPAISGAVSQYQKAIPEMTKAYGMDQYKESPLYTPMVTNLAELQATPGYQFQLAQGQKALAQSAAARGGLLSGAQLQAAQGFGQQQAATGFQNAWQRAQSAYQNAFAQNLETQKQQQSVLANNITAANALAGGYQNAASLAGTGAGLYGQGMNLYNQNIANRMGAVNIGGNAVGNLNTARINAANAMGTSWQNMANAGQQNAYNQANITNSAIGQGLSALGGLANYGQQNGWFTPSQSGADMITSLPMWS